MKDFYPLYLEAIHRRICKLCAESTADGTCGLSLSLVCPIEKFLPRVVDVVHSVSNKLIKDYVPHLREHVCQRCPNKNFNDTCPLRRNAECPLARYFPLIVEAVEEVDEMVSWPQSC